MNEYLDVFYSYHKQEILRKYSRLKIGNILNETPKIDWNIPGSLSKVPYGEASAFQGFPSPFYNESHRKFRTAVRAFYQEEVEEEALLFDENGKPASDQVFQKLGSFIAEKFLIKLDTDGDEMTYQNGSAFFDKSQNYMNFLQLKGYYICIFPFYVVVFNSSLEIQSSVCD